MDENLTSEKRESMTQSVDIQTKTRHFSSLGNSDAEYTSFLPVVSSMDLYFKVKTKFFKKVSKMGTSNLAVLSFSRT